eukprot:gene26840-32438_t
MDVRAVSAHLLGSEPVSSVTVSKTFPTHGLSLRFILEDFYSACGGRNAVASLTTEEMSREVVKPLTEQYRCSACELFAAAQLPCVRRAEVFISHAWGYKFVDVMDALAHHFRDGLDVVIWFDLFSNNQHDTTEKDFDWWCGTFKGAIRDLGKTVMVFAPWHNPLPLTRAWCLFELYATIDEGSALSVAMSPEEEQKFIHDLSMDYGAVDDMLASVNVEKSEAWNQEDRRKIFDVVRCTVGFNKINAMVFERMRGWVISVMEAVLKAKSIQKGEGDPETLSSMDDLAVLYSSQGLYDKSEPLYVQCLEKRRVVLGEDHPDTLSSMNNLAALYESQGLYDKAEPLFMQCLEKSRVVSGENHPNTLTSMNNLAGLYESQGLYDKSEPLYVQCLEKSRVVLGQDHPDTLMSMNNLAALYSSQGLYDKAEPLFVQCLEKRRVVLGEVHPDTLSSMNNLAALYESQGLYDNAEPLYVHCLEKRRVVLGEDHPDTLMSMNNLAVLYSSQGLYNKAEPLYVQCLEKRRVVLGEDHPDTLMSMNNLAGLYESQGRHHKTEPMHVKGKATEVFDEVPPDIVSNKIPFRLAKALQIFSEEQTHNIGRPASLDSFGGNYSLDMQMAE